MKALIDTCVLLRAFDRSAVEHGTILLGLRALLEQQADIFVAVQNIAEFWNVARRPIPNNGFGLKSGQVESYLSIVDRFTQTIVENLRSFEIWRKLVSEHSVKGARVHDARIVSVMIAQQIDTIVTFNVTDFVSFSGIRAVTPAQISTSSIL